ncbi:histidine phosphatase family protein [Alphaproteobacteria bacterium]|nr:histidine phosphatase family protein [Alphaproteobacteria bacterium]
MTELFVIRHAITDWNNEKRFQGHSDIPINAAGREEISRFKLPVDWTDAELLSSPLSRARETAEILCQRTPTIDNALLEMNWGLWEGRTYAELKAELGTELTKNEDLGLDLCPVGGESPREVCQRLKLWFKQLIASPENRVVAVTHKGIIRAMMAMAYDWNMLGKAPAKLQRYAGHHFKIEQGGQIVAVKMNARLRERTSD